MCLVATMTTKVCYTCKLDIGIDLFPCNKSRPDGRAGTCLKCQRVYTKRHYDRNRSRYLDKQKKRAQDASRFIKDFKNDKPCVDCGIMFHNEPWLKDFDHIPGCDKVGAVSQLTNYGVDVVKKEIEKCEIVCLICHRRRTALRSGWSI